MWQFYLMWKKCIRIRKCIFLYYYGKSKEGTSRNKTFEILTVYLRKGQIYKYIKGGSINMVKRFCSFGGTEVLLIQGSELTDGLNQYCYQKEKGM